MQQGNLADWKSRNNHPNITGVGGCGAAGSWQLSWLMLGDALGQVAQACLCFPGSHTAVHTWVVTSMKARGGLGWQRGAQHSWLSLFLLGFWVQLSLLTA